MNLTVVLFAATAAVVAVSALGVVLSRSVVRAAVWLLFTLIGVAVVYFLLGAEFLGAAQLIVYVGGTLVLMVFGVMLTNQGPFAGIPPKRLEWAVGGTVAAGLFALLVVASFSAARPPNSAAVDTPLPGIEELGKSFLGVPETDPRTPAGDPAPPRATHYLLPFEIVSVHLLVVLVAAAYLARAKRRRSQIDDRQPSPTQAEA